MMPETVPKSPYPLFYLKYSLYICGMNNKQMKLYTEEQVKKAMMMSAELKGDTRYCSYAFSTDEVLEKLTPIELPSDEEIWVMSGKYTEKCGLKNFFDEDVIKKHWVQAYKSAIKDFQINKIQGANNK